MGDPSTWDHMPLIPSLGGCEDRRDIAGQREEYKAGGEKNLLQYEGAVWGSQPSEVWEGSMSIGTGKNSGGCPLTFSDPSAFTPW